MTKTDESIRRICLASIKRSASQPILFPSSKIHETELLSDLQEFTALESAVSNEELPIATTYVDDTNWTLLTTKRIISRVLGQTSFALSQHVTGWNWNDFKGYEQQPVTLGTLTLTDGSLLEVYIETGNASMIMIKGIMTLTKLASITE